MILCLPFIFLLIYIYFLLLFIIEYFGCVIERVFWFIIILVGVRL